MTDRLPWEIMENESPLWYERFDYYRKMPPTERSIRGACWGSLGKETKRYQDWWEHAKQWKWVSRAQAWDDFVYREKMKLEMEETKDMLRRQAQIGKEMQMLAKAKIVDEFNEIKKVGRPLFDIAEARLLYKEGISIERQARGLPDYLLAVANLSDEELLSRYDRLLADITQTERVESIGIGDGGEGDDASAFDQPPPSELPDNILE
jgi:hypothetical protein